MGNRLSKITTRTGDGGSTGLATGDRIAKNHARIHAIGEVDELNCFLGSLLALKLPEGIRATLAPCQHELFNLGGELSMPPAALITEAHLQRLDDAIVEWNASLPPLKEFVIPGGDEASARAHIARSVCRRTERSVWALKNCPNEAVNSDALRYLNRLSDLLFVICRVLARENGTEVAWNR